MIRFGCAALVLLSACNPEPGNDSGDVVDTADPAACHSDHWWNGGNSESPLMHPGGDCITCHTDSREGPTFSVAGTVYTSQNEPLDCDGLQGVEVVITDSEGASISLTTNAAGNFYASPSQYSPVMPITAVVRTADGERAMATPQASGNCASCHTADGTGGAPGRVMAP